MNVGFWMTLLSWVLARLDEYRARNKTRQCPGVRGRGIKCD